MDPRRFPALAPAQPLCFLPVAQLVLLAVAALVLLLRIVALVMGRRSDDSPTYPEPKLQLDTAPEAPSDVFGELESTLVADHAADARYLEHGGGQLSASLPVSKKVLVTGLGIALLVGAAYVHPELGLFQVLTAPADAADGEPIAAPLPSASVGEAKLPGATQDQQARARELDAPAPDSRGPIAAGGKTDRIEMPPAVKEDAPPRAIDDPSGKALDAFFAKLARVERKEPGAVARVLYYGDSIVASDFVSGKLRRMLQSRFGDAGHGYALIANAWPGWFHIDVKRTAAESWGVSTCVGPYAEDGFYGLGCASFTSRHPNVWSEFGTADLDDWGRHVSRFEIEYLRQPGGGALRLFVDGAEREILETDGALALAHHVVALDDGPHTLKIEAVDDRPVRTFGIRMERDVPGVTLSALGITGARARFLDKQDDAHWGAALRAAKPDLVCLAFGSNEITDGNMYPMEDYRRTLAAVMEQVEKAVPDASLMLVGPPDMASSKASQGHSRPMVHFIVKHQKEIAAERGWAFWDQYRAMGGGGSMWSWMKAGLGSQDMFHPTGQGGSVLGKWEYYALMEAYEKYKAARR